MPNPMFDLSRCPDCGRIQKKPKKLYDSCENPDCECYVTKWGKRLAWTNPNWG